MRSESSLLDGKGLVRLVLHEKLLVGTGLQTVSEISIDQDPSSRLRGLYDRYPGTHLVNLRDLKLTEKVFFSLFLSQQHFHLTLLSVFRVTDRLVCEPFTIDNLNHKNLQN